MDAGFGNTRGHIVHTYPADKMFPREESAWMHKCQFDWRYEKRIAKKKHTRKSRRYLKRVLQQEIMEGPSKGWRWTLS